MDIGIREIKPKNLPYLTQIEEVSDDERAYSEVIYLGIYDDESNYREASEEEKQEWEMRINSVFP